MKTKIVNTEIYRHKCNVDSSLASGDAIVKSFLDSARDANIGIIDKINTDINPPAGTPVNIWDAENLLTMIEAPDTAEATYQTVYGIWLNMLENGESYADSTEQAALIPIAEECPDQYGMAVFSARALLSPVDTNLFYNSCEVFDTTGGGHKAIHREPNNTSTTMAKVYPNPANSLLNVQVDLQPNTVDNICLYSSMGQAVRCETLKSNVTTLSISDLQPGIYYYRIIDSDGNLIKADKVIIVR